MAGTIVSKTIAHRSRGVVQMKATFTTDGAGVATALVVGQAWGRIVGVSYDPVTGGVATGAVITISDADSGAALVTFTNAGTAAFFKRVTQVITDNTGAAVTAATTAVDVNRDIFVAGRLKVGVTAGGATKTGYIRIFVDEGN